MESVKRAEVLKNWLASVGKTREELGNELGGVSKRTVDNWCAGRPVPDTMWGKICGLMNKPPFGYSSVVAVPVRFTESEWQAVKSKIPAGVDVEVYLRELLLSEADGISTPAPAVGSGYGAAREPFA